MRLTLSKSEILRGYKSFTRVMSTGKSISAPPIRCFYVHCTRSHPRIRAGFSVSRTYRKAVDRNRVKRLMRESFRLGKHPIIQECVERDWSFDIVFMYIGQQSKPLEQATLRDVRPAVEKSMTMILTGKAG